MVSSDDRVSNARRRSLQSLHDMGSSPVASRFNGRSGTGIQRVLSHACPASKGSNVFDGISFIKLFLAACKEFPARVPRQMGNRARQVLTAKPSNGLSREKDERPE